MGHEAEWLFTAIAIIFASFALYLGWKSHNKLHIILMLSVGIIGLLVARGLESGHHHIEEDDDE